MNTNDTSTLYSFDGLLSEWIAEGELLHNEISRIVQRQFYGFLDTNLIEEKIIDLKAFFNKRLVMGKIVELPGNQFEFLLYFPELFNEELKFTTCSGLANVCKNIFDVTFSRDLTITLHALERLYERLGSIELIDAVKEIYSSIDQSKTLKLAAKQLEAQSWPMISEHGIFVSSISQVTDHNNLITWMQFEQLSKKWGSVADNLRQIKLSRPELLKNLSFCIEFIKSFPWMLRKHKPDIDSNLDREQEILYLIPGLNYLEYPPPFKLHSRHEGVVVQIQQNGELIVSLKNGFFGALSVRYMSILNKNEGKIFDLQIGDDISVIVLKLNLVSQDNFFTLSLGIAEYEDEKWKQVVNKNPAGSLVYGVVLYESSDWYYVKLDCGAMGKIPIQKHEKLNIQSNIQAKVIGFQSDTRQIFLTCNVEGGNYFKENVCEASLGSKHEGFVYKKLRSEAGVLVLLPNDVCGLLDGYNLRGESMPSIGDMICVEVVQHDSDSGNLFLAIDNEGIDSINFYPSLKLNDEMWIRVKNKYPIETIVEGQVSDFHNRQDYHSTNIVLKDGVCGYLLDKELSWNKLLNIDKSFLIPGNLISLKVIGFVESKRMLIFSYRQNLIHPLDDLTKCPKIGDIFVGKVYNILDYGSFINLPIGFDGLLHKSQLPVNFQLSLEQDVDVVVIEVNIVSRRISLGLAH